MIVDGAKNRDVAQWQSGMEELHQLSIDLSLPVALETKYTS